MGTPYMELIQDTVSLEIVAEKTVVNDSVKLVAEIVALVETGKAEEILRAEIKSTMKGLVDADWQFTNMKRSIDDSGVERVRLQASVRVSERENYNLDKRAEQVSRPGLVIVKVEVEVDTSVPQHMLDEAESDLRVTLSAKALTERDKLSKALGNDYRIHALMFGSVANLSLSNAANSKANYGSGFSDDTLGNASKLTMTASVTLARVHAYMDSNTEKPTSRLRLFNK
jgi:hypothetical protein